MTPPVPRPPAPPAPAPLSAVSPATPYVAAWMLYVYDEQAFLTWDGRLVATAAATTPAQETRIEGAFDRLTHGHAARRAALATRLALDRR